MQLNWKSFKIDLKSFQKMLVQSCSNADGIIACEDYFEIVEKTPLTEQEIATIQSYYNALDEAVEQQKLDRPYRLKFALLNCKETLLTESYDNMSVIQRKIVLNLELTEEEKDMLISIYG